MIRKRLAIGMNHHRVSGRFRWIRIKAAPRSQRRPDMVRDPLGPARAIILGVPLSILLWVGLYIALR